MIMTSKIWSLWYLGKYTRYQVTHSLLKCRRHPKLSRNREHHNDTRSIRSRSQSSLPADVLWGSLVTRTPKDVCGEARANQNAWTCLSMYNKDVCSWTIKYCSLSRTKTDDKYINKIFRIFFFLFSLLLLLLLLLLLFLNYHKIARR